MTTDISMDFGIAVTGAAYKLMDSSGVLGSEVTTGFANVSGTTIYYGADVDVGSSRGIYWYCDTAGITGFSLFRLGDVSTIASDVTDILTEIQKVPRTGTTHTYTNQTSLEADTVAIS